LLSGHIEAASGKIHRSGIIRTVYQQDGLFPWLTVSENISLGPSTNNGKIHRVDELYELLELVHMKDFASHYPHQL